MDWKTYFIQIAKLVSMRSTCVRRQVGGIAVLDKRVLATGYNGAPSGLEHCSKIGCLRKKLNIPSGQNHEVCRGVHAEQNIIIQCALYGVSLKGADIYCTNTPCAQCAKMLINCQIKNFYYLESYPDELALEMLQESGINLIKL